MRQQYKSNEEIDDKKVAEEPIFEVVKQKGDDIEGDNKQQVKIEIKENEESNQKSPVDNKKEIVEKEEQK